MSSWPLAISQNPQTAEEPSLRASSASVGSREEIPGSFQAVVARQVLVPAYKTVLGLLAVALVCRIGAALWWGDLLWADSVFYRQVTDALHQGNFTKAFDSLGLNLYPVILMGLDWLAATLGTDWTVVGKWWSVALASLAVLPLYGWVRRMFNDRAAFWAGLFYALHPHLVGHSPLIIRDPTYWFLFNLALYWSWRAVTEARLGVFLGAGLCLGLAAYTRIEGWILLVVLVGWSLCRLVVVAEARWRLALGTLLAVGTIPAGVVLVNLTWLKDHPQWEWGRLPWFLRIWDWATDRIEDIFSSDVGGRLPLGSPPRKQPGDIFQVKRFPGANSTGPAKPALGKRPLGSRAQEAHSSGGKLLLVQKQISISKPPSSAPHRPSESAQPGERPKDAEWVQARRVALRLIKALTYPYALLIGIGLLHVWRIPLRADQLLLSLHNLLLFLATWAYQSLSGGIDSRYFLPLLMTAFPYAAVGFEAVLAGICWLVNPGRGSWHPVGRIITPGALVLLVGLGLFDLQPSATKLMRQQTALGQWILRNFGPGTKIFCPESASILLSYHAQAECHSWPPLADSNPDVLRQLLVQDQPDVVILWQDPIYSDTQWMHFVAELCPSLDYQKIPADELPEPARHCQVWIRRPNRPLADGKVPAFPPE